MKTENRIFGYAKSALLFLLLFGYAPFVLVANETQEDELLAQNKTSVNPIEALFDKYSENIGFTIVNITPDMFNMFKNMSEDSGNREDFAEAISGINTLKVLSYKQEANTKLTAADLYKEITTSVPLKNYKELMTVKDNETNVRFLYKGDDKNVRELLMLVGEPDECTLIWINGSIDLKSISKLKKLGFKGMEDLDKLKLKAEKGKKSDSKDKKKDKD